MIVVGLPAPPRLVVRYSPHRRDPFRYLVELLCGHSFWMHFGRYWVPQYTRIGCLECGQREGA